MEKTLRIMSIMKMQFSLHPNMQCISIKKLTCKVATYSGPHAMVFISDFLKGGGGGGGGGGGKIKKDSQKDSFNILFGTKLKLTNGGSETETF